MAEVEWSQAAVKALADIGSRRAADMDAIVAKVEQFVRTDRGDVKKLTSRGDEWRLRAGRWRLVMRRRPDGSYLVKSVSDRRDAYDD